MCAQLCGLQCRIFRYHPCCKIGSGLRSYWLRPQRFAQSRFLKLLLLMAHCSCMETSSKPKGSGLFQVTELGVPWEPGGGSMASLVPALRSPVHVNVSGAQATGVAFLGSEYFVSESVWKYSSPLIRRKCSTFLSSL